MVKCSLWIIWYLIIIKNDTLDGQVVDMFTILAQEYLMLIDN